MIPPKKPYTRPTVTPLAADDPRARALFAQASGLALCCGILWSVEQQTDWYVGVTPSTGASFDGRCGVCENPLRKEPR